MNEYDVEELAYRAIGKTEKETEEALNREDGAIDELLYEKYECTFDSYIKIVEDLLKFTMPITSPLTQEEFYAFVDNEKRRAIVKKKRSS